jgi:hypothetical protein
MRIKYTEFALNPALRGTISHLPQHRAQALIDSGAAVELPYKNHVEYLNDYEAQRIAALPKSAAPATGWGIRESTSNDQRMRFVVTETSPLGETTFYDAPPAHAPLSVKQKFADAVATDAAAFSSREEFLQQQKKHVEPTQRYPAQGIALTIIGANGVVKRG